MKSPHTPCLAIGAMCTEELPKGGMASSRARNWRLFKRVLLERPDEALAVAWLRLTNRRERAARRLRDAALIVLEPYAAWIDLVEVLHRTRQARPTRRVSICVVRLSQGSTEAVEAQDWIVDWAGARPGSAPEAFCCLRDAIIACTSDLVVPVGRETVLADKALEEFAACFVSAPEFPAYFGDHDRVDAFGRRRDPYFKPRWNAELALAQDYVSQVCAIRTSLVKVAVTAFSARAPSVHALLLHVASKASEAPMHVPRILAHLPPGIDEAREQQERLAHVRDFIAGTGATVARDRFGILRVSWPLPDVLPTVSIIIPTRDQVALVSRCVELILADTDYPEFEILIVDNGSCEPRTRAWFNIITRDRRVRVLRFEGPFNFSAINNFAAREACGSYLCLLNNDTEIRNGSWLTELMRYAVRPGIGAVGSKLLYADHSIQHAGVCVGLGNAAGHVHRALDDSKPGYFALAHSAHFVSAVTAACLVVARDKYEAVGGLDETAFRVAYNDVDFCLKLQRHGWRNVYAPQSVLLHLESKSRGSDFSPEHRARYLRELAELQARWATESYMDPVHHPALDRASEEYRIAV